MQRSHAAPHFCALIAATLALSACGRVGFASRPPDDASGGDLDAGPGDAGSDDAGPRDAGAGAGGACGSTQWRDFAAMTCRDCPAATLTCASIDTATMTTFFDYGSGIFHMSLTPGLAQVTRGTLTLMITDSSGTHPQPVTVAPSSNILIASTATLLHDPSITALSIASLELTDQCGAVSPIPNFRATFMIGGGTIVVTDFFCG